MVDIGSRLLALLYFMLPAYLANMAPPLLRFWHGWNRPLHARLLGAHKTVLGIVVGVVAALLATALQAWLAAPWSLVDYHRWPWLGFAFGIGALGGDALKSLLKRRLGMAPGQRWVPFDQLDFVVGSLLLAGPAAHLSWLDALQVLVISFLGDLMVNRLAWRLGIKRTPW